MQYHEHLFNKRIDDNDEKDHCYIVAWWFCWCNEGKMFCCNQYLIHIIVVVVDNINIYYIMLSLLLCWLLLLLLLNLSFFLYDPIDGGDSGDDNNADNILVAFIAVDSTCVILVCSFSSFYSWVILLTFCIIRFNSN